MQKTTNKKGAFIAFEGIDGSGKSTQITLLKQRLQREGINCYSTCEPTDSPIGSLIHQIMTGRVLSDNKVIAALFVADRLDHLLNPTNGIYAKIMDGTSVISDRYYFSSYAYHSVDMPMDWVIEANSQSAEILRPSVTIFVDVNPDNALKRIAKTRFHPELFETRERLISVREKYFEAFEKLKDVENVLIVDGEKEEHILEAEIWEKIKAYFAH
ncbi:MAG: dTMP kinase [Clostridiales bacterium]|nr:dTMP kinase [Clostridiales bacterium]